MSRSEIVDGGNSPNEQNRSRSEITIVRKSDNIEIAPTTNMSYIDVADELRKRNKVIFYGYAAPIPSKIYLLGTNNKIIEIDEVIKKK